MMQRPPRFTRTDTLVPYTTLFRAHHVKSSVACLNGGRGGRSTRSYRQEGSWDIALAEAKVPGYRGTCVLIQFAHNDQSSKPERWTDEATEFPANLRRFVEEVRAAGATPVLVKIGRASCRERGCQYG